jgi:putative transposase
MPPSPRPQRQPTDDWQQLRLLVTSSEQEAYELVRPIVLFGQPTAARARETGVPDRTLRRKVARFARSGMRSLIEPAETPASTDRRRLPLGIRKAIVELKAECPALRPYEIATICRHRFGRAVGHHTVGRVLAADPLPLHPPRRIPRYRDIADPVARRKAIVELYEEGWTVTRIAEYLATSRSRVYDTQQRWVAEDLAGLADRSRAPHHHARKVDLKAMVAIRRLQANPELGEFRIHAATPGQVAERAGSAGDGDRPESHRADESHQAPDNPGPAERVTAPGGRRQPGKHGDRHRRANHRAAVELALTSQDR